MEGLIISNSINVDLMPKFYSFNGVGSISIIFNKVFFDWHSPYGMGDQNYFSWIINDRIFTWSRLRRTRMSSVTVTWLGTRNLVLSRRGSVFSVVERSTITLIQPVINLNTFYCSKPEFCQDVVLWCLLRLWLVLLH